MIREDSKTNEATSRRAFKYALIMNNPKTSIIKNSADEMMIVIRRPPVL
jgi:hypothetical protein